MMYLYSAGLGSRRVLFVFLNDNFPTRICSGTSSQPEKSVSIDRQNWIIIDAIYKMKCFYKILPREKQGTSGTKSFKDGAILPFSSKMRVIAVPQRTGLWQPV